jgi:hypothetical protein
LRSFGKQNKIRDLFSSSYRKDREKAGGKDQNRNKQKKKKEKPNVALFQDESDSVNDFVLVWVEKASRPCFLVSPSPSPAVNHWKQKKGEEKGKSIDFVESKVIVILLYTTHFHRSKRRFHLSWSINRVLLHNNDYSDRALDGKRHSRRR